MYVTTPSQFYIFTDLFQISLFSWEELHGNCTSTSTRILLQADINQLPIKDGKYYFQTRWNQRMALNPQRNSRVTNPPRWLIPKPNQSGRHSLTTNLFLPLCGHWSRCSIRSLLNWLPIVRTKNLPNVLMCVLLLLLFAQAVTR